MGAKMEQVMKKDPVGRSADDQSVEDIADDDDEESKNEGNIPQVRTGGVAKSQI